MSLVSVFFFAFQVQLEAVHLMAYTVHSVQGKGKLRQRVFLLGETGFKQLLKGAEIFLVDLLAFFCGVVWLLLVLLT